MIFEGPPEQMHAVGQQRGGEGVAGKTLVEAAVEGEGERRIAVDTAALRQAAHADSPIL
jgi:hypothetical protein